MVGDRHLFDRSSGHGARINGYLVLIVRRRDLVGGGEDSYRAYQRRDRLDDAIRLLEWSSFPRR